MIILNGEWCRLEGPNGATPAPIVYVSMLWEVAGRCGRLQGVVGRLSEVVGSCSRL